MLESVGVSLGGRRVLADIDLELAPGAAVGIVGPNGSGKTTLTRVVATLVHIEQGSSRILGRDPRDGNARAIRRRIGLIGHQPSLLPELTLGENLDHLARLAGLDRSRVATALDVVGLGGAAGVRASAASFGMQRRAEIAHLLMRRPDLLILDEAASGLDESARDLIGALSESVRSRDGGIVMVSHERAVVESTCDTVMTLAAGRLGGPGQ